jgi:hypothetical protein
VAPTGGATVEQKGFLASIVAPIVSLVYLIYTRVFLEVIIVLFRIMETNVELVQLTRAATVAPTPPPAPPEVPPTT